MRSSDTVTVIYTEKGDFLEIPTPEKPPLLGQTIEITVKPQRKSSLNPSWLKYSAAAAVFLLVFSLSAFYLLFNPNMAVASVELELNQGITLTLNKEGKIVATNQVMVSDDFIEGLSLKGMDIYQAVGLILKNAENKGILNPTDSLILATVIPLTEKGAQAVSLEKLRTTVSEEMLRQNLSGNIVLNKADPNIEQSARKEGMSVNRYLIYDRSQERGIPLQPASLRTGNVQKALADAQVDVSTLFPTESYKVNPEHSKDDSSASTTKPWSNKDEAAPSNHSDRSSSTPSNQKTPPEQYQDEPAAVNPRTESPHNSWEQPRSPDFPSSEDSNRSYFQYSPERYPRQNSDWEKSGSW